MAPFSGFIALEYLNGEMYLGLLVSLRDFFQPERGDVSGWRCNAGKLIFRVAQRRVGESSAEHRHPAAAVRFYLEQHRIG